MLLCYEVANALHRYLVHGVLLSGEAAAALEVALELGIMLFGDAELHRRALEIAGGYGLPAVYDAHYLALAERLGGGVVDIGPPAAPGGRRSPALGVAGRMTGDPVGIAESAEFWKVSMVKNCRIDHQRIR